MLVQACRLQSAGSSFRERKDDVEHGHLLRDSARSGRRAVHGSSQTGKIPVRVETVGHVLVAAD